MIEQFISNLKCKSVLKVIQYLSTAADRCHEVPFTLEFKNVESVVRVANFNKFHLSFSIAIFMIESNNTNCLGVISVQ